MANELLINNQLIFKQGAYSVNKNAYNVQVDQGLQGVQSRIIDVGASDQVLVIDPEWYERGYIFFQNVTGTSNTDGYYISIGRNTVDGIKYFNRLYYGDVSCYRIYSDETISSGGVGTIQVISSGGTQKLQFMLCRA